MRQAKVFCFPFKKNVKKSCFCVGNCPTLNIDEKKTSVSPISTKEKKRTSWTTTIKVNFGERELFWFWKFWDPQSDFFKIICANFHGILEKPDSNFKILLFSSLKQKTLKMPKKIYLRFLKHFDPFFLPKNLKENERLNTL